MSAAIVRLFSGQIAPGVYRLDMNLQPEAICHRVEQQGWRCFHLDGRAVYDKQSLLAQIAKAMDFPDYYGHNWDAFEECVTDLPWIEEPAFLLLYDNAAMLVAQHPEVWSTLYAILSTAVESWIARSRRFYVVLRNAGDIQQSVPAL